MNTRSTTRSRMPLADVVMCLLFAVTFALGYLEAGQWSLRTALFPRLITAGGFLLALLRLLTLLRHRSVTAEGRAGPQVGGVTVVDDEEAEEQSVEYVFEHAGRRAWMEALAWIFGFFVGLYVLGLYVTVPAFTVGYLRVAGRASWWVALVYAAVAWTVLYLAFTQLLHLPVPTGIFG